MFMRTYVGIALGCSALFLAGCGGRAETENVKAQANKALAAGDPSTTLHVEGMTKRLNLF
jgi:hypothetical protein